MRAEVVEVIQETPTIKTVVMHPDKPYAFRAGQFAQLTYPGMGEAPFTPSSSPLEPERIEVTILRTGKVTDALHDNVRVGDVLGLRGPFGKGYPIEKTVGKEIIVVGGGVGLAPLRALILALMADLKSVKRLRIMNGARNPSELLFRRQYEDWASRSNVNVAITVDNPAPGWTGNVGVVTTLLKNIDVDVANCLAFSCGPSVMLKFVTLALLELKLTPEQIYLSMNRKMSCGIGKCGRCNIGPYYLCKDGPDMCYAEIMNYPNVFA
jgi:NAD(P)H-flavin reductase